MNKTKDFQSNFTYRPNPLLARSFLICRKEQNGAVTPVGDYTVLDDKEDLHLSERKVINLIMRLNGETKALDLGERTRSRMLFHVKPRPEDDPHTEIVFFTQTGQGVSKENAILTLEGFNG